MAVTQTDDGDEGITQINRRTYLGLVALGLLDFSFRDALFGPDESKIIVDEEDERDDYDEDDFELFIARDTAAMYVENEEDGGWKKLPATGLSPDLEAPTVNRLRRNNLGVSASLESDQTISTGTETTLALANVSDPYFDDFDELDESTNKITIAHRGYHELVAQGYINGASSAGDLDLRIYVNDVLRAETSDSVKNGEETGLDTQIYLELEAGDVVEITIEHDTGGDETFDSTKTFASVVGQ